LLEYRVDRVQINLKKETSLEDLRDFVDRLDARARGSAATTTTARRLTSGQTPCRHTI